MLSFVTFSFIIESWLILSPLATGTSSVPIRLALYFTSLPFNLPKIYSSVFSVPFFFSFPFSLSTHTILFFLLINTLFHYFLSLWKFFFAKLKGQGLVTDHWSSDWDLVLSPLQSSLNLWPGTKDPFQAAETWGHLRSSAETGQQVEERIIWISVSNIARKGGLKLCKGSELWLRKPAPGAGYNPGRKPEWEPTT